MANTFAATITAAFRHADAASLDPSAPSHSIVIELDAELSAALEAHALACGISPSALVTLWIKPHLRDLCHRSPQSPFSASPAGLAEDGEAPKGGEHDRMGC